LQNNHNRDNRIIFSRITIIICSFFAENEAEQLSLSTLFGMEKKIFSLADRAIFLNLGYKTSLLEKRLIFYENVFSNIVFYILHPKKLETYYFFIINFTGT
jgi:hypothetical protein